MEHSGLDWVPQACTLPTAERPLRVAAFDKLFAAAVRAAELAAAETGCCSFFTFILTVTGGSAGLDIVVPAAQTAVLDALAQRASSLCVLDRLPNCGLRSR
jgi:hypothetical protein